MDKKQAMHRLRAEIDKAGSQAQYARQIGVTSAYISDIILGKREMGPTVLNALGLKKKKTVTVSYEERKK